MKIKRFNEQQEIVEISTDRVSEMVSLLKQINSLLDNKSKDIHSMYNELMNFRSKSTTANNQIDDTYLNLEGIVHSLEEITSKIDTVVESLDDYIENGPRYLYG